MRFALLTAVLAFVSGCAARPAQELPPNVIIVFADDLGYADIGPFGAEQIETPHLDRMADEGARLTTFYVPTSVCTPSRAALLTGSYPMRVGMPQVLFPRSLTGLNPEETTIADVLREAGYATLAVGKWHLGDHPEFLPTNHGFDRYLGIPYSNDMLRDTTRAEGSRARTNPGLPVIRDTIVVERAPDQATFIRRLTDEAIGFMEEHRDRPFFVYFASPFPHIPLYASDAYRGTSEAGLYGDVVAEIDGAVGEMLAAVERLGVDERTLVIFTSDNGPWLVYGDHAGSSGPLREGKGTSFEGGHRVPFVARWPGRIPAGLVSDEAVTSMDLLPTIAGLAAATLPSGVVIDGENVWPILSGARGAQSPHEVIYYYNRYDLEAVRSGRWKLHAPHAYHSLEGGEAGRGGSRGEYRQHSIGLALFDLEADPGERMDVAAEYPEVVERLQGHLEEARREIGDGATNTEGSAAREPGRVAAPWTAQERFGLVHGAGR